MIVVNWVSFIRNIFFLVKSIFLSAGGAFEVQFLVLRMSPALNRFISIRWTMQKWPVTGGSLYFKSKCSPEHLFQQKFKLMVKPLCEVASFLFLRSCMYSTLYFFCCTPLQGICYPAVLYIYQMLTFVAYTCSAPPWCTCVPKDVARHRQLEQELLDTWGILEVQNVFL